MMCGPEFRQAAINRCRYHRIDHREVVTSINTVSDSLELYSIFVIVAGAHPMSAQGKNADEALLHLDTALLAPGLPVLPEDTDPFHA